MTGAPRDGDETLPVHAVAAVGRVVLAFGDGMTSSAPLTPGVEIVIGRDEGCGLRIDHPSVSRRHAAISGHDELTIRDLGSKNGTRLGTRVLMADESAPLPPGAVAMVGAMAVTVQGSRALSAATPPPTKGGADRDHDIVQNGFLRETAPLIDRVAASNLSVLLLGETGVGKDAIAEHIHLRSPRHAKPLLRLNCSALSESLLESELFGHEQGAFTGAARRRIGLLESADGGTIFVDEVGELPRSVQVKLLRVLEDRRITRVGGTDAKRVDVRFIAATNRDLAAEIEGGGFREDLYFRLSGVTLLIPPLRERRDEILPLAQAFLRRASKGALSLSEDASALLRKHDWPGNVRELRNVIERSAVLANGRLLRAEDVLLAPARTRPSGAGSTKAPTEAERIAEALQACSGNQTRAAAVLGISRRTLVNRLNSLGMPRPRK